MKFINFIFTEILIVIVRYLKKNNLTYDSKKFF